ncbi:MAG: energy-coupling factor transporter ATPase, partial [Oscillospiraceae bacterium]|nr:energy-coupling factor transporter ATPase [Oscillospiraceae bacterium]
INSDRIIIMDSGRIVLEGSPKEIFPQVEKLRALSLTVPQTVELMYELNKHGFSLPLDCISEDECVAALASAIKR